MKNKASYLRTDVASECLTEERKASPSGIKISRIDENGFEITKTEISTAEAASALGKPIGVYIGVYTGKIWLESDEKRDLCVQTLSKITRELLFDKTRPESVMICGLGNRFITSDAVGSLCAKELNANLHIKKSDPRIFSLLGSLPYSVITPGVTGQTGMEAADIVKGAVKAVNPSAVICIDALASRSVDRLGVTVQISNTGISPGSGIGNHRKAIDEASLGVPVISIGLPTVVSSSTLVYEALDKAGINDISPELEAVLENGKGFFVTLKDADTVLYEMSKLIASSLRLALSRNTHAPPVI